MPGLNGNDNGNSNGNGMGLPGGAPAVHIPKPGAEQNVRQDIIRDRFPVLPHIETYSGKFNSATRSYYIYYDEALRDSQANSLSMRRDGFVHEILRHRQLPVVSLPWHIETDDPEHPDQKTISETVTKIIQNIPRFQGMLLTLLEAIFYGKYAVQAKIGPRKVSGNKWNSIIDFIPVNGDKIRYWFDGTPGIALRTGSEDDPSEENSVLHRFKDHIHTTMLGKALFLDTPFLRDRFIIHEFERSDTDYLFEIEEALSVHGLGLRSRLYWDWNTRMEVLGWMLTALQRVGANGMIYGFYPMSNSSAKAQVVNALRTLTQENVAAFPFEPTNPNYKDMIGKIDPSAVGYDVMMGLIDHFEGNMRRATLGQDLSSQSKPTGIGGGASDFQADVRADYQEYDANMLSESLNSQLLENIILKYNRFKYEGKEYSGNDLPFGMKHAFDMDRENVQERIESATAAFTMGVEISKKAVQKSLGFPPPMDDDDILVNPQFGQQAQEAAAQVPGMDKADPKQKSLVNGTMERAAKAGMLPASKPKTASDKPKPSRFSRTGRIDAEKEILSVINELPPLFPDYGHIFYNMENGKVFIVSSDSDENEIIHKYIESIENIPGVTDVQCEAEHLPKDIGTMAKANLPWVKIERTVKSRFAKPKEVYALHGKLYVSKSGWGLVSVPNDFVYGLFNAINQTGVELPPASDHSKQKLNAHISVISKEEIEKIGRDSLKERGHSFSYNIGRIKEVKPAGWSEMEKVWFVDVDSPELEDLRESYGLSRLPKNGKHRFHISLAVRKAKARFSKQGDCGHDSDGHFSKDNICAKSDSQSQPQPESRQSRREATIIDMKKKFVGDVQEAISKVDPRLHKGSYNAKIWIYDLWNEYKKTDKFMSYERFKEELIEANRDRAIDLARHDMPHALSKGEFAVHQLSESKMHGTDVTFHYVITKKSRFAKAGTEGDCGHEVEGMRQAGKFAERNTCAGEGKKSNTDRKTEKQFKSLYQKTPKAKVEIDSLASSIAESVDNGSTVAKAPIKSEKRALEKIKNDYNGDAYRIKDLVRNTIVAPDHLHGDIIQYLKSNNANIKVIESDPLCYTGINASITTKSGIQAEIQINSAAMIYAKEQPDISRSIIGGKAYNDIYEKTGLEGGFGHKLYEKYRSLPLGHPERDSIESESCDYYKQIRSGGA